MDDTTMEDGRTAGEGDAAVRPAAEQRLEGRIDMVVSSIQARLGPAVDADRIRVEVEREFASYADARIRDYVPILVETRVRLRLARTPSPDGLPRARSRSPGDGHTP